VNAGVIINVSIPLTLYPQRLDYLKRVIDRLLPQLQDQDSLVFVDDHSCAEVRAYLDDLATETLPRIAVLHRDLASLPEQLSEDGRPWRLASSRNLGIHQCKEQHFWAFLDADCLPVASWLEAFRQRVIDETYAHGRPHAVIFGKTRHPLGKDEGGDPRLAGRSPGRPAGRIVALFERGGGGNMAITRAAWEQLRGFDEEFDGGFGYEETEFACRLYEAGGEVWYEPNAEVLHLYHGRPKPHFHNIERNRRLFMAKTGLSAFAR